MSTEPYHAPQAAQPSRKAKRLSMSGARQIQRVPGSQESSIRRQTLLLTPASNKRLSSFGSGGPIPSQLGSNGPTVETFQSVASTPFSSQGYPSGFGQTSSQTGSQRSSDPRPLRDKNYQALISKEIHDFCVGNRFELETGHPITLKSLRQPTQKDFVLLFQFLYGKIDPAYKFTRSVESEVFMLLKALQYPYLEGINRSAISAVGGQHWPVFLGMLYWLVKLLLEMSGLEDQALIGPDDVFDKIFFGYVLSSYQNFMNQKEDYTEYRDKMRAEYDAARADVSKQAEEMKLQTSELSETLRKINAQYNEMEEAKQKSKALENDLKQFSEYMYKVKERQKQWRGILEQIEIDIDSASSRLADLEAQKQAYEAEIKEKGFSVNEIDQLNLEKEKINRLLNTVSNRIEDLKDALVQKDNDIYRSLQSLQNFVNQYNSMTARLPSRDSDGYELAINSAMIGDGSSALEPDDVLSKKVRIEKIRLSEVKSELKQELLRVQGEAIKIVESVDQISEKIFEQQEEIESVETGVAKLKDTQDEIHETMVNDTTIRSAQNEKLERDLQAMQINSKKGVIELEAKYHDLKITLKETRYEVQQQREHLHSTVVKMLSDIISTKMGIQENLEDLVASTQEQLEQELKRIADQQ